MDNDVKQLNVRIGNKHDSGLNWNNSDLTPLAGELIVYDDYSYTDTDDNIQTIGKQLVKVGDGNNSVNELKLIGAGITEGQATGSIESLYSKTTSKHAVAIGDHTVAGCRAYWIKAINFDTKKVYLSDNTLLEDRTPPEILSGNSDYSAYEIDNFESLTGDPLIDYVIQDDTVTPKIPGDRFSLIIGVPHFMCGTIVNIEKNVITYLEDSLKLDSTGAKTDAQWLTDRIAVLNKLASPRMKDYCLYVASKPTKGVIDPFAWQQAFGVETIASGNYAHAEGANTVAGCDGAHAEGMDTIAGYAAHAEGKETSAIGQDSHAEGYRTLALDHNAHAEGYETQAQGINSHAEGYWSTAKGQDSHAEGHATRALGNYSHAEGQETFARNACAHTEGLYTEAEGEAAHAEGKSSKAFGNFSHSEGLQTVAEGPESHAEGHSSKATGEGAHAEGRGTEATGAYSHSEGFGTKAQNEQAHTEGTYTAASGKNSHAEGQQTTASNDNTHSEGIHTTASGKAAHAEGGYNAALGDFTHTEGAENKASNTYAHAEGWSVDATGIASHAEGRDTTASGNHSHAEGRLTIAEGENSHAEGGESQATASFAHAEGYKGFATADFSHAEGRETTASGEVSHAEGYKTTASGKYSHASGNHTTAGFENQFVVGKYNANDENNVFEIGYGTNNAPKNVFSVAKDGTGLIGGNKVATTNEVNAILSNLDAALNGVIEEQYNALDIKFVKGVWKFNEMPSFNNLGIPFLDETGMYAKLAINFTSNGTEYTSMCCDYYNIPVSNLLYNDTVVYREYEGMYWENEAYRIVDFGTEPQEVTQEFYDWFTANAVRQ